MALREKTVDDFRVDAHILLRLTFEAYLKWQGSTGDERAFVDWVCDTLDTRATEYAATRGQDPTD